MAATTSRTKEQTAMLLKLTHMNKENFKCKNIAERQRIWQRISDVLNRMPGAEKSVDGWKKAFWSWRLQVGDDYDKEVKRWINRAPAMTTIEVGDNKAINDALGRSVYEGDDNDDGDNDDDGDDAVFVSEEQEQRLHALMTENSDLLCSGSRDEPLKSLMWANIAAELNDLPGVQLTAEEWRRSIKHERDRTIAKATKRKTDDICQEENAAVEVVGNYLQEAREDNDVVSEILNADEQADDEQDIDEISIPYDYGSDDDDDDDNGTSELCSERDVKDSSRKAKRRKLMSPPLVKSFKFSQRMAGAVERLNADVSNLKASMAQTNISLVNVEDAMDRFIKRQDDTNALLRRNNQLLRVLIELKMDGKR